MAAPLEFTGEFGGFVFTDEGKRRMLLRHGGHERLLKVPRVLRRRIIGKFHAGETIRVAVTEETHPETGALRQVVSQVLPDAADPVGCSWTPPAIPAVSCVVRVCSKKNCWRNGGRELFEALCRQRDASPHADGIEIRQVGCLDHCKHAPNAEVGKRAHTRCSPRDAAAIIAQAVGHSPLQAVEKE